MNHLRIRVIMTHERRFCVQISPDGGNWYPIAEYFNQDAAISLAEVIKAMNIAVNPIAAKIIWKHEP